MLTTTGDNLNILICTEYYPHNDWMTFLTWYSVHKSLPSAQVAISCSRNPTNTQQLFVWPFRCKVKCFQHKKLGIHNNIKTAIKNQVISTPLLILTPETIAIKEFSQLCINKINNLNCATNSTGTVLFFRDQLESEAPVVDELDTTFTDYDALKQFRLKEWCKEKQSPPFNLFWKFYHENMTVNEAKILNLWKNIRQTYEMLRLTEL